MSGDSTPQSKDTDWKIGSKPKMKPCIAYRRQACSKCRDWTWKAGNNNAFSQSPQTSQSLLLPDTADFKTKLIHTDKECLYILVRGNHCKYLCTEPKCTQLHGTRTMDMKGQATSIPSQWQILVPHFTVREAKQTQNSRNARAGPSYWAKRLSRHPQRLSSNSRIHICLSSTWRFFKNRL